MGSARRRTDPGERRLPDEQIDDVDRAIIAELQRDGRRPYRAIARSLGLPEATVRFRANRLQETGVISITAFAHPERLGHGVLATVFVKTTAPRRTSIAEQLSGWPEVMYLSSLAGQADLMLQVVARSLEQLHGLVGTRIAGLEGVLETETIIELEVHKAHYEFPTP